MLQLAIDDPVTSAFLALLILLFVALLKPLYRATYRDSRRDRKLIQIAPSLLATLGVLGTFLGIFIGLLGFDVTAIDASVPALLAGLRTAFLTSLAGMGLSVIYRLMTALAPMSPSKKDTSLPQALRALAEEQRHGREALVSRMEAICVAIVDDRDGTGSLATRVDGLRAKLSNEFERLDESMAARANHLDDVVKARLESRQNQAKALHDEQLAEFRSFADHMVENTHGALIEALESVIADFNDKLTTQFGENFKQLNTAVGKLVEWQVRYREHIELIESRMEVTTDSLESSAQSIAVIERAATIIPTAIEPLRPTMEAICHSLNRVNEDLEAYADLHDKARAVFPLVNENLESITTGMETTVSSLIARTEKAMTEHDLAQNRLHAGYDRIRLQADRSCEIFSRSIEDMMRHMSSSLKSAADASSASMNETLASTDKHMKEQVRQLDEDAQEALTRVLELVSGNLAAISDRLAKSYEGVADRLVVVAAATPPTLSTRSKSRA